MGSGNSSLHELARRGDADGLSQLLGSSAEQRSSIDAVDEDKCTALALACAEGHLTCVKVLLAHEASVKVRDGLGFSPLHRSLHTDSLDVLKMLLARGANARTRNILGVEPLHWACVWNATKCLKHLLELGVVDVNSVQSNGSTALHLCALHDHVEAAQLVLEYGASSTLKDKEGCRPIDLAQSAQMQQLLAAAAAAAAVPNSSNA